MRFPSSKCRVTMTAQTLYNKGNWVLNVLPKMPFVQRFAAVYACEHLKTKFGVLYILRNPLECLPAFVPNDSIETVSITSLTSCRQVTKVVP